MNTLKSILAAVFVTAALAAPAAASNHSPFTSATANSVPGSQFGTRVPVIQDCVHVPFPQCGGV